MANVMKNMMKKLKLIEDDDEELFPEEEEQLVVKKPEPSAKELKENSSANLQRRGKIVNIHTTTQLKVVVVQPESFEDSKEIADHLKTKKPIVVNLENIDQDVAKKIINFLSGAVYALDGNIQKISGGIFLIVPYNMGIMGDFKDELRDKVIFPF